MPEAFTANDEFFTYSSHYSLFSDSTTTAQFAFNWSSFSELLRYLLSPGKRLSEQILWRLLELIFTGLILMP